jgi:hypothetical protein
MLTVFAVFAVFTVLTEFAVFAAFAVLTEFAAFVVFAEFEKLRFCRDACFEISKVFTLIIIL